MDVHGAQLAAVLGIGFDVEGDLLALGKRLEAVRDDRGEMNENVIAAVVVGNEALTFFVVEPFDRTSIHLLVPPF